MKLFDKVYKKRRCFRVQTQNVRFSPAIKKKLPVGAFSRVHLMADNALHRQ